MPQESGKSQEARLWVDTAAIPAYERTHSKRMAQVMEPRGRTTEWEFDRKSRQEMVKRLTHRTGVDCSATS